VGPAGIPNLDRAAGIQFPMRPRDEENRIGYGSENTRQSAGESFTFEFQKRLWGTHAARFATGENNCGGEHCFRL